MRILGRIPVRAPFPWSPLLGYFGRRLIPDAERIEDGRYLRRAGDAEVAVAFESHQSHLVVSADGVVDRKEALARAAVLFDAAFDPAPAMAHLRKSRLLASRIERAPGMRPPGAWSPFELCVRTILGQQVTVAAAGTLMRRLTGRCGLLTPEAMLRADLNAIGMPGSRIQTLLGLAGAVAEGRLALEQRPWPEIDEALRSLRGFGPWTRAYLAIRLGRMPDAFPETDIGLMRAAKADSPKALLKMAERWRPWRAHAAIYLWSAG